MYYNLNDSSLFKDFFFEKYFSTPKSQKDFIRYKKFINSRKFREITEGAYVEVHHIVPKSFLPKDFDIHEKNNFNNLIVLTGREHFIAHLILWKAFSGKMTFAFSRMCHSNQNGSIFNLTSTQYNTLRSDWAKNQSNSMNERIRIFNNHTGSRKCINKENLDFYLEKGWTKGSNIKGKKHPMFGKTHRDDVKKHLSEVQKTKKGSLSPHFGKKVNTEGKEKMRKAKLGKVHAYNPNDPSFYSKIFNSEDDIPAGWKRGSRRCENLTEEERKKFSTNKGKKLSKETRQKMSKNRIGSKWMTNGKENHFVHPENFSFYEEKGYTYGYIATQKQKNGNKKRIGSKIMNNKFEQKLVSKDQIANYLKNGWFFGKLSKNNV